MTLITAALGRLGSRFATVWDPHAQHVKYSGAGVPYASPCEVEIGVNVDGVTRIFPFAASSDHGPFASVEQLFSACSMRLRGFVAETGTLVELIARAPFYPGNLETSLLPSLLFEVRVEARPDLLRQHGDLPGNHYDSAPRRPYGEVFVRIRKPDARVYPATGGTGLRIDYTQDLTAIDPGWNDIGPPQGPAAAGFTDALYPLVEGDGQIDPDGGLSWVFDLDQGRDRFGFGWSSYSESTFLKSSAGENRLRYTDLFHSIDHVVATTRSRADAIVADTTRFEAVFADSDLGARFSELSQIALQWFFLNTWWLENSKTGQWFTVTEGKCLFFSTVDVEYNIAPFYLAFWPGLLKMQLQQWTHHLDDEGYLHHDMGRLPQAVRCQYPHPMACEESANYLLMLLAYTAVTRDTDLLDEVWAPASRMGDYLLGADETGNGLPNRGTANTIDDASDAVQFAAENVYLGVKVYAALRALRHLTVLRDRAADVTRLTAYESQFVATFDRDAWCGDHYATCLVSDQTQTEVFTDSAAALVGAVSEADANVSKKHRVSGMDNWDAASLYTSNGLFYLYLAGVDHGLNEDRLRQDMLYSQAHSLSDYGCYHSEADDSNVWISQNIWRDAVGAYLGLDLSNNLDRYLRFQRFANSGGRTRGFIDTYGWNNLHSYPRGVALIAYFYGFNRLSADPDAGLSKSSVYPFRLPHRLHVPNPASWKDGTQTLLTADRASQLARGSAFSCPQPVV